MEYYNFIEVDSRIEIYRVTMAGTIRTSTLIDKYDANECSLQFVNDRVNLFISNATKPVISTPSAITTYINKTIINE